MTTQTAEEVLEIQTFHFTKSVQIAAPIEITFDAILADLGPEGEMPDGAPYPYTFEPWPGGRWFRDLGNNTGHLWGHVQVIKPPKLLEIVGPTFMSYPATNHVQYRLVADGDGSTRLAIAHRAFGYMPRGFVAGAEIGWEHGLRHIATIAARLTSERSAAAAKR
jgi:hypothetical protein